MTTSIELILSEIITEMQTEGLQVSGRIGESFLLSRNAEDEFPAFLFEILTDNVNPETYLQTISIKYVLCYRSQEQSDKVEVDNFIELRDLNLTFVNKLRDYENSNGQQLLNLLSINQKPYYFDLIFLETKTKGMVVDIVLTAQPTRVC